MARSEKLKQRIAIVAGLEFTPAKLIDDDGYLVYVMSPDQARELE